MKIDWKRKLTSRKLWVSVASFVGNIMVATGFSNSVVTQVTATIMAGASCIAYIVAEGLSDAAHTGTTETEENNNDEK